MARGENTAGHPGRQVGRARWEIVAGTHTGSERVSYSLTGHGRGTTGQHMQNFGTREEAHGYMERNRLEHYLPRD